MEKWFSNFNAFRLPKDCEENLYDSIGTVNSIRLVVACASGVEPKFIDDKNYFWIYFESFCFCPGATKGIVASVTSQLSKEREVTASPIFFLVFLMQ